MPSACFIKHATVPGSAAISHPYVADGALSYYLTVVSTHGSRVELMFSIGTEGNVCEELHVVSPVPSRLMLGAPPHSEPMCSSRAKMRIALALVDPRDIDVARQVLGLTEHHQVDVTDEVDLLVLDAALVDRPELRAHLLADQTDVLTIGVADPLPGAIANLERPLDGEQLRRALDELAGLGDDRVREAIGLVSDTSLFAGTSQAIQQLAHDISLIAPSDEPVSVFGDDGSGRWVVARAIHERSSRRQQRFIAVNAAAHTHDRLDKLLFGEDGAVASAASGTLFIDRLAMAGPATQRQLVHTLQAPTAHRPRMIAGMRTGIAVGFGSPNVIPDLYYRLKVFELEIPRLRDRARDLEAIIGAMLSSFRADTKIEVGSDALRLLQRYSFPGNLLELAHILIHAVVIASGRSIRAEHLPASVRRELDDHAVAVQELGSLDEIVKRFERDYLLQVLRAVGGSRGRAATILGLSRKGLWGKLKAHAITNEEIHLAAELPSEGSRR
jgi:DNA-binding NtrC family response regulator